MWVSFALGHFYPFYHSHFSYLYQWVCLHEVFLVVYLESRQLIHSLESTAARSTSLRSVSSSTSLMFDWTFTPNNITFFFFTEPSFLLANFQLQVPIFVPCHLVLALRDKKETQLHALLSVCEPNKSCAGTNQQTLKEVMQSVITNDAPLLFTYKWSVDWRAMSKVCTSCNCLQLIYCGSWYLNMPFKYWCYLAKPK